MKGKILEQNQKPADTRRPAFYNKRTSLISNTSLIHLKQTKQYTKQLESANKIITRTETRKRERESKMVEISKL